MHPVTFGLPDPLLCAAEQLAKACGTSLGAVIRAALSAEIRRANLPAKTPNRAEERLVDPLWALLTVDFGQARGWKGLQSRLAAKGFTLCEAGGGLALHAISGGKRLCKASELGHAYANLMRRFGKPFPGWNHGRPDHGIPHEKAPIPHNRQRGHSMSHD